MAKETTRKKCPRRASEGTCCSIGEAEALGLSIKIRRRNAPQSHNAIHPCLRFPNVSIASAICLHAVCMLS
eukprot:scaffold1126_cov112-Skeletonema_dohrnii-CCMP3373.AAC.3